MPSARYAYGAGHVDVSVPAPTCSRCEKMRPAFTFQRHTALVWDTTQGYGRHVAEAKDIETAQKIAEALNAMDIL